MQVNANNYTLTFLFAGKKIAVGEKGKKKDNGGDALTSANTTGEEFKQPLKKWPLPGIVAEWKWFFFSFILYSYPCLLCKHALSNFDHFHFTEACAAMYALDQECRFERMMEVLEQTNKQQAGFLNVDPEIEAFVNGIAFSLQRPLVSSVKGSSLKSIS